MKPGTILGHEAVGVVEEVGDAVRGFSPGDRVIVCSTVSCGICPQCRAGNTAQCDVANPNGETSGITTTRLRYRYASYHGGFSAWRTGAVTTARSARIPVTAGYDYCFEAQATDLSGNTSAWSAPTCIARALDDRSLSASSGWVRKTGSHFYLHTATNTSRTGRALARTKAVLDRVGVVATTCRWCGAVRVYVGRHYIGTVSLRSSSTHYQRVLLLKPFSLRSGTVKLVTTSGKLVQVDGLVISRS